MTLNLKKIQRFISFYMPVVAVFVAAFVLSGCDDDDPVKEDVPELITTATLAFTPQSGGNVVTVTATDPDGEGIKGIEVDGPINLEANKTYSMSISLINGLAQPSDPAYNITEEVEEEGDEHMFYFSWTNNVFSDPEGNGNIDNRSDEVGYQDQDSNALPLGLETSWTTAAAATGEFRVLLKHQPDLKSATSGSSEGETDLDITFTIVIQ
ncbi:hypothetical protein [Chryseolinea sp. H1M3-3]|uniref:hypothetical protein n=1 Tax=Chryseolinea sp. H1M3-3 TaxID=3034144 RepID=UPI0023ECF0B0|nr:hypothetical protein [Chryseolinea sp. H1M3-3]